MYIGPMTLRLPDGRRVILRSAEAADAAADLRCMQAVFGETEYLLSTPEEVDPDAGRHAERLTAVAEDPWGLLLLCVLGDEVVGRLHGCVKPRSKVRHRFRLGLAVRRAYWGQGIASALLARAEEAARGMGCTLLELEVMAHNHRAIRLYERAGCRIAMVHPQAVRFEDGRVADEYLMIKKL